MSWRWPISVSSGRPDWRPDWRPFLDPLPVDGLWLWLSLPLILVICIVYKAIRLDDLRLLWRQSAWLAVQVMLGFGLVAMGVWLLAGLF